jgi:hypothetical protein
MSPPSFSVSVAISVSRLFLLFTPHIAPPAGKNSEAFALGGLAWVAMRAVQLAPARSNQAEIRTETRKKSCNPKKRKLR